MDYLEDYEEGHLQWKGPQLLGGYVLDQIAMLSLLTRIPSSLVLLLVDHLVM